MELNRKLVYETFAGLASIEVANLEQASRNPREAQLERLHAIVENGRRSAFGKEHGFSAIKTYSDFRASTPMGDYEQFRPYIDRIAAGERRVLTRREPFMLATTSSTTSASKLIPITEEFMQEFRNASKASCANLYRQFPRLSQGCVLSVFSPAEEGRTPGGTPYGAISGALFLREPHPVKHHIMPIPYEVFCIKDYEARYYCLLRAALALPISSIYTLNPSTITLIASRLKSRGRDLVRDLFDGVARPFGEVSPAAMKALSGLIKPQRQLARTLEKLVENNEFVPHRIWPELQVVSCWTRGAAGFYLSDFPELFGSVPVCDITYGASEGRGTVFLSQNEQMLAIRSHFYEFIPEGEINSPHPTVLLADELTQGTNYYILFSTSGGLYRYHINDVVKVTGFHNRTPLIEFQYKGGNVHSFTGEKVSELQITQAMAQTLKDLSMKIKFFTVIPEFRPSPHYSLWVEPLDEGSLAGAALSQLSEVFDRQMSCSNVEYRTKRESGRLDAVTIELLDVGSYEAFRREETLRGVADSQIKPSHLNPKSDTRSFFEGRLMHGSARTSG